MALTELQIVAALITIVTFGLLYIAVNDWFPKKKTDMDEFLDAIINGFEFELPQEVELYQKLKEEKPEDKDALFKMLFRRTVAAIPLIRKVQAETAGIQRLRRNDILKDGFFASYKYAEDMVNQEIREIREEAELLKPGEGWPEKIFPQAVQFINHMTETQQQMEEQQAKQDASNAVEAKEKEDKASRKRK